jgi:tripartite-type tricarboxylate transporter receptor subunit TctC
MSDPLTKALGQPIVAENRGGAGGTLAASQVAQAAPDGHTLMLGNGGNLAVAPSLYKRLSYDPQKDFASIGMVARSQLLLVVHPSLPVTSVRELIELARKKPGQVNYASSGVGAGPHLAAELFKSLAGVNIGHVPYSGSAPMLAALMGGHVDIAFDSIATSLPHARAGRLRALAVSGDSRSPLAPDLQTVAQAGVPGFGYSSYFALVAPAKTPTKVLGRISSELMRVANSTEMRERLQALGLEASPLAAAELDGLLRKERSMWSTIVETAGIKVE